MSLRDRTPPWHLLPMCAVWPKKARTFVALIAWTSVGLVLYVSLYYECEPWRVYGGDMLPSFTEFTSLPYDPEWARYVLCVFAWVLPVVVVGYATSFLVRRWGHWWWLILLSIIPAYLVARTSVIDRRLWQCSVRCTACASLAAGVQDLRMPLPQTCKYREFIVHAHGEGLPLGLFYCPARHRTRSETGMVFVGGGLDLRFVAPTPAQPVLIAFCEWQSHPAPYDQQNVLLWDASGNLRRQWAGASGMIEYIETALGQARSGAVPYSDDAVITLRSELSHRQNAERR
jgi:hypothetical protein